MHPNKSPKIWSETEENYIRSNIQSMTNIELAVGLNVSLDTVNMKVRKMMKDEGIRREKFKQTFSAIEGERWTGIAGFPGYEISDHGRARKVSGEQDGIFLIQLSRNPQGYMQVAPTNGGVRKTLRVARLVAMAFVARSSDQQTQVNHLDGDKENNHYTNLEWCTPSENIRHAFDTGLNKGYDKKGQSWKRRITEDQVHTMCRMLQDGLTNSDILKEFDLEGSTIVSQIRCRKTWTHISASYKW